MVLNRADFLRAEAVLDELLDLEPEERHERLSELCGGDGALTQAVEELLEANDEIGDFLTSPGDSRSRSGRASQMLGKYRLLERIGTGGMGEVWLADQTDSLPRRVAVKIIKRGMDSHEILRRFELEQNALAMMDSPAIARVYDAGETPRGRPYFVMEHVPGIPITEHCDHHRLNTRERLELFTRACEGVLHAHRKGIVHRDLKPSNILVSVAGGTPQPKIIDFGIAKAMTGSFTRATLYTERGAIIGTPEYMSPEQAGLGGQDIDTQTDVYSLGVVLYELLVGQLPFTSPELREVGVEEFKRRVREVEPVAPSDRLARIGADLKRVALNRRNDINTLRRLIAGDLDWIILKALEKGRDRRYRTVYEFAEDIRRYLESLPVRARQTKATYRVKKFVQRHTLAVTLGSLGLLLVVGIAIGMSVLASRLAKQRDRANLEAESSRRVADSIVRILESVNPAEARASKLEPGEFLHEAARRLERDLAAEPLILSRVLMTIGEAYRRMALLERAEATFRRAQQLRRETLGEADVSTLEATTALANIYGVRGELDIAIPLQRNVLDGLRSVVGPNDPETIRALHTMGILLGEHGNLPGAKECFQAALDAARSKHAQDPYLAAASASNLGVVYAKRGEFSEAESMMRYGLSQHLQLSGEDHPATLNVMANLGRSLVDQDKLDEAGSYLAEAALGFARVLGPDHRKTVMADGNLGTLEKRRGNLASAEQHLTRALSQITLIHGRAHPRTIEQAVELAELYRLQGRATDAAEILRDSIELAKAATLRDHPIRGELLLEFGVHLENEDRVNEAVDAFASAYETLYRYSGPKHPKTKAALESLERLSNDLGLGLELEQRRLEWDVGANGETGACRAAGNRRAANASR